MIEAQIGFFFFCTLVFFAIGVFFLYLTDQLESVFAFIFKHKTYKAEKLRLKKLYQEWELSLDEEFQKVQPLRDFMATMGIVGDSAIINFLTMPGWLSLIKPSLHAAILVNSPNRLNHKILGNGGFVDYLEDFPQINWVEKYKHKSKWRECHEEALHEARLSVIPSMVYLYHHLEEFKASISMYRVVYSTPTDKEEAIRYVLPESFKQAFMETKNLNRQIKLDMSLACFLLIYEKPPSFTLIMEHNVCFITCKIKGTLYCFDNKDKPTPTLTKIIPKFKYS